MPTGRKLRSCNANGVRRSPVAPLTEIPDPPAWMRPAAARRFNEVCDYLIGINAITVAEVGVVEQYAACYGRWVEAEQELSKVAVNYRAVLNRQGEEASAVALPAMMQASKSLDQMHRLGACLGLNPTERSRLPATKSGEVDEMDLLLARNNAEPQGRWG